MPYAKTCESCGKPFTARIERRRVCSRICAIAKAHQAKTLPVVLPFATSAALQKLIEQPEIARLRPSIQRDIKVAYHRAFEDGQV